MKKESSKVQMIPRKMPNRGFLNSIKSTIDTHLPICLSQRMEPFQLLDVEGPLMYKNKLQEQAQKSGLPLPIYQNVNEGFHHAPSFRSTVVVGNKKYISQKTYPDRRAAEQEAAKLAFGSISENVKKEDYSSVYENPILCKSILHEYATKMNMKIPKYHTANAGGLRQVFISSFVFGGQTYTGEVAKSKKVAEQLVARTAIRSLLGSNSGILAEIIKSKDKLYASLHGNKSSGNGTISNLAGQLDQPPQKEDQIQIAGLPPDRETNIQAELATSCARLKRTTDYANVTKRKTETNSMKMRKMKSFS